MHVPVGEIHLPMWEMLFQVRYPFFLWGKLTFLWGKCGFLWGNKSSCGGNIFSMWVNVTSCEENSPSCAGILFAVVERHLPMKQRRPVQEHISSVRTLTVGKTPPPVGGTLHSVVSTHLHVGERWLLIWKHNFLEEETHLPVKEHIFLWRNSPSCGVYLSPSGETHLPEWVSFFHSEKSNFLWGSTQSHRGMQIPCGGIHLPTGEYNILLGNEQNAPSLGGNSTSCAGILLSVGEHIFFCGNTSSFGGNIPFCEETHLYVDEIQLP